MANTNVTMRIDETLKAQLQELMSSLGLDMTTFFTMAAKQAVREQALPFKPDMNTGIYEIEKTEILKLDPFQKLGKPAKIAGYFGGKAGYMQAVKELEEAIYADEAV